MSLPSVIARSVATRQSHHSLMSFAAPFCHSHSLSVIPAQAGIHPSVIVNFQRKYVNLNIPLYFSSFSVIASTALGARQSRIMSSQAAIYKNPAISSFLYVIPAPLCHFRESGNLYLPYFPFIFQYSPFLHYKNYKKTIFFINITIFTLWIVIH